MIQKSYRKRAGKPPGEWEANVARLLDGQNGGIHACSERRAKIGQRSEAMEPRLESHFPAPGKYRPPYFKRMCSVRQECINVYLPGSVG